MKLKDVDITSIASYQPPGITAIFQGRSVKIIASGNAPGHSPVVQFIEHDGSLGWAKESEFTICDTQYLPPSTQGLMQALRALKVPGGL